MKLKLDGVAHLKEENRAYLCIKLDRQLSMNKFLKDLKEKASNRLNLMKRLASITLNAKEGTLRQLYLGYMRLAMDYALPIQEIATKQENEPVDRIQNQAV